MTEEAAQRIARDYVPDELHTEEDIRDFLEGRFPRWNQKQLDAFGGAIAEQRAPQREGVSPKRVGLSGPGASGERTVMIKDAQGRWFGNADKVKFWRDRWGNLMGHNTQTGRRAKIQGPE